MYAQSHNTIFVCRNNHPVTLFHNNLNNNLALDLAIIPVHRSSCSHALRHTWRKTVEISAIIHEVITCSESYNSEEHSHTWPLNEQTREQTSLQPWRHLS